MYSRSLFARSIFQSTLPIQGETNVALTPFSVKIISIHSPYTGRDELDNNLTTEERDFNPLSLYRERRDRKEAEARNRCISIHSPYTGRDESHNVRCGKENYFNPLSLYRERPKKQLMTSRKRNFNPLSLYRERLQLWICRWCLWRISIHSPYTGRDSNFAHKTPNIQPISYAKRQTKELFPTPTQQIITSLALISSISRCESPCIFMCTSHSH